VTWRRAAVAASVVVGVFAIGVALWLWHRTRPHTITGSSTTEFVTTSGPVVRRPPNVVRTEPWPTYGGDVQRTHLASGVSLRPPFRRVWTYRGGGLIEFPPAIAYGALYVPVERGLLVALNATTGKTIWHRKYHACIASSPTVGNGVVYQTMMNPCSEPHEGRAGMVVALDARTGKELWRLHPGASESSPLLVNGTLYFGSRDHHVYAVNARNGRLRWSFATGGEVKGGTAYADRTIFVGSYDGFVYAIDARTGRLRWKTGAENALLRGRGAFYATPTLAYGRVFIGSTDGVVYAFGAAHGTLLWARPTRGYVYSSAAVWRRTIYVGSYDRHFYALDAATGKVRWSFAAGAPISGSPTVMAGLVYFSTLKDRTFAVNTRTGGVVWRFADGQYSPLVAEPARAYLVGHGRIYALGSRRR
jgi:outer membrane protein assembly factor BamB